MRIMGLQAQRGASDGDLRIPLAANSNALGFQPTPVHGAWVVEGRRRGDERGFFSRMFCAADFASLGLESRFAQVNTSLSRRRHTLRGMHYQLPPAAEVKLVRCTAGALFDVVADLRPDSPSFGKWFGTELTPGNGRMLYVPRGCAHGFLTLAEDTEALYLVSDAYAPEQERGLRFDDPAFGIGWPAAPEEVSAKDRGWPDFDAAFHGTERMRHLV
jgi:dTDP-4-dehydrorhamnose 3,5-epimerase